MVAAQSYIPMLNDSLYWDVAYAVNDPSPCAIFGVSGPVRYALGNDTIFNSTVYKQVIGFAFEPFSPSGCPPFVVDTVSQPYDYYLREDTVSKKVYSFNPLSQVESLLFDFSLQLHDSIFLPSFLTPNTYFYVDTLYTIVTSDGISRKFYECFQHPNQGTTGGYYIEGLGGAMGPFMRPYYGFEEGYWVLCISDLNESTIYGSTGICFNFNTGIIDPESSKETVSVYPVPANEYIFLNTTSAYSSYRIYNILGEIVNTSKLTTDSKIDISNFEPGIYYIIFNFGNKMDSVRFIKQ